LAWKLVEYMTESLKNFGKVLETFEVSGMFHPVADMVVLRRHINEKNIEVARTLLHENVHRLQHYVSTAGIMVRMAWGHIFTIMEELFEKSPIIPLPLKTHFLPLLKTSAPRKLKDAISAFSYLARWADLGVSTASDTSYSVELSSVLSKSMKVELSI